MRKITRCPKCDREMSSVNANGPTYFFLNHSQEIYLFVCQTKGCERRALIQTVVESKKYD